MFKRFLVIDLYHAGDNFEVKEWVDAKNGKPTIDNAIYKVRLENGDETKAYYCSDHCLPMMGYFKEKPSCWWDKIDKTPLYNVTHWGKND
jgi:hypothetical protein